MRQELSGLAASRGSALGRARVRLPHVVDVVAEYIEPSDVDAELARLHDTLDAAPLAVCVQDTEDPAAVTAATCHADPDSHAVLWWTWRVLPESGHILRTRAQLRLRTPVKLAA